MKKILPFTLALITVLLLVSVAFAYSWYDDTYPLYKIDSNDPDGTCCLYDRPSGTDGRNLGQYDNGDYVRVIWDNGNGWYYVACTDGKEGYIDSRFLTPARAQSSRETYRVRSQSSGGYCTMYDQPSEIYGTDLGHYDDGELIEIVEWNASEDYAQVMSPRTGKYGYMLKTCLQPCN